MGDEDEIYGKNYYIVGRTINGTCDGKEVSIFAFIHFKTSIEYLGSVRQNRWNRCLLNFIDSDICFGNTITYFIN